MILHQQMGLSIYFGDAASCPTYNQDSQFGIFCERLCTIFSLQGLVLQKQTHSASGRFIQEKVYGFTLLDSRGDYLATNQKMLAVGVLTADCLPVVVYDPIHRAVAVIHAGWKGSFAGIVVHALEYLVSTMRCSSEDLQIFFGPAANVCCYEVQQDFCDQLEKIMSMPKDVLIKRGDKIYFDAVLFNTRLLCEAGVKEKNINKKYNVCTMCTEGFHSHRRSGGLPGRQVSCAWLSDY